MNVETIQMKPKEARRKIEAWRHRLDRNPDPKAREEYRAALAGYKALARGTPIINLMEVILAAPRDEKHRPTLAVIGADARTCYLSMSPGGEVEFRAEGSYRSNARWGRRFWFETNLRIEQRVSAEAIVPMIPPDVGPKRIDLAQHAILWEAHWSEPPVDPMLLRPLAGDLYAVIAAWNLTPLERAVIAGRLRQ